MNANVIRILIVLLALSCASVSYAEPTVQDWIKEKDNLILYVAGLGQGISWANAYLRNTQQKPIYCVPKNLNLVVENYVTIIDTQIREEPRVKMDTPLGFVLLNGYIATFPCPAIR
jgi:hypothetical protein